MNRSLLSGVFSVISSKIVIMLIGLVTTPLLYRLLNPSGFGDYAFLMSIFSIFMIFVSSGITDGVRKFIAEDRDMPDWEPHVVGYYFRLAVIFAVAGAAVLSIAAREGLVAYIWGTEFTPYFYVLAGLVIASQFRAYARKTLMGFGLERYSEPLNALDTAAFAAFALPLVYLGYGVIGALLGLMLASLLVAAIGLFLVQRQVPLSSIVRRPPAEFPRRKMFTFNSLSIVLVLMLSSLYHIDIVMLQTFRESAEVGNYRAALTLAEFLWFVPLALQTVFVHSMSEMWSQDEIDRISTIASQTTRYTFLLTAVMAVGLAALADTVVPIYFGADATPAVEPLLLLLPGALGFALARPILAISQGKGQLQYPIAATGAAAVINLVLNFLLIPRFGMAGAAIATSTGYGSMFVFHCLSARQVGFFPLSDARLGRTALTTALAAVPIFVLADLLSMELAVPVVGPIPISLFVVPPVGFLIFAGFTLLTGAMGLRETASLFAEFPDPIGSTATAVIDRIESLDLRGLSGSSLQFLLIGGGILLLIVGLAFALIAPGVGDSPTGSDGGDDPPGTEIPIEGENGDDDSTGETSAEEADAESDPPDGGSDEVDGETPVEPQTPTEDGDGLEDPDREEAPLESESEPEADTPDDQTEETETGAPVETESDTDGAEEGTETDLPEATPTETEAQEPTETPEESDTDGPTDSEDAPDTRTEAESPTETPDEPETETEAEEPADTGTEEPTETETEAEEPSEPETETGDSPEQETEAEEPSTESGTETPTETEPPADTPPETDSPTEEPTETPTETEQPPTETPTETDPEEPPTETPTETEPPTENETETATENETATPTETETETDEPTATPTEPPTETEEPTETEAPTETEEPSTDTPAETEEPTEVETETETDTPTETGNESADDES